MPGNISRYDRSIYHLLRRTLCQYVAIAQIVDLDVLDVVSICDVDTVHEAGGALASGRRSGFRGRTGGLRQVSKMEGTVKHAQLTERIGGTSTCWMPFFACS